MSTQYPGDMKNDPRSVYELVTAALSAQDDDERWLMVAGLHWKGTLDVVHRAEQLSKSDCKQERELAADMVAQLGVRNRTYEKEVRELLRSRLAIENDLDVLYSILIALGHQSDIAAIPQVVVFANHPDRDIRYGVISALSGLEDSIAIDCLIQMTNDSDPDIRDWACFALGSQIDTDNEPIRAALAARLEDEDDWTRSEAIKGLAKRKDVRAIIALRRELSADEVHDCMLDAIEAAANPEFLPWLLELQQDPDFHHYKLADAIKACSNLSSS